MGPVNLKKRSKCEIVQVTGGYSPEEKEAPANAPLCRRLLKWQLLLERLTLDTPNYPSHWTPPLTTHPSLLLVMPPPLTLTKYMHLPHSPQANPSQVTLCPNMPSATATNSSVSALVYWCLLTAVWYGNQSADSSNFLLWSIKSKIYVSVKQLWGNVVKICQISLYLKQNYHKQRKTDQCLHLHRCSAEIPLN